MFPLLSLFELVAGLTHDKSHPYLAEASCLGFWTLELGALESSFLCRAGLRHPEVCLALKG